MASNTEMVLFTVLSLLAFTAASAMEFIVGGERGWIRPDAVKGLDYTAWSDTITFLVGDSLVFNYNSSTHNVLSVTGAGFTSCNVTEPLETFTGGKTTIQFVKAGRWWFICGTPGHCSSGQAFKITVTAAPVPGLHFSSPPVSPPDTTPESSAGKALVKSLSAAGMLASILVGFSLL